MGTPGLLSYKQDGEQSNEHTMLMFILIPQQSKRVRRISRAGQIDYDQSHLPLQSAYTGSAVQSLCFAQTL